MLRTTITQTARTAVRTVESGGATRSFATTSVMKKTVTEKKETKKAIRPKPTKAKVVEKSILSLTCSWVNLQLIVSVLLFQSN